MPGMTLAGKVVNGYVGTGVVTAAHGTWKRQIGRHARDFFRDAEVALEGKSLHRRRADTGGNTFVA